MGIYAKKWFLLHPEGGDTGGQGDPGDGGQGSGDLGKNTPPDGGKGEGDSGKTPPKDDSQGNNDPGDNDAMWSDPAKAKAYAKGLRKESAKYRTSAKDFETKFNSLNGKFDNLQNGMKKALGIEDDSTTPEEKIKGLHNTVETLEFESAIKDIAIEHGLKGQKSLNYLKFLVQESAGSLEDGKELSDEQIIELVGQTQKAFGSSSNSTSVPGGQGGNNPPNPSGGTDIKVEDFASMSLSEKSDLFTKNRPLYDSLMRKATEKNLIR